MTSFSMLFRKDIAKLTDNIKRQPLYSPRGWARCVFPVFSTNDKEARGCGSGFFVKGLDFGVTAEHLIDIESIDIPLSADCNSQLDLSGLPFGLATLLPSQEIVFGTRQIDSEYSQSVKRFIFDIVEKDDPMLFSLSRRLTRRSDILLLEFFESAAIPPSDWRPRISVRTPKKGDWVCAVGFPDIQVQCMPTNELHLFIREEGMAISFARVTQIEPSGRGQYETTPVVFVDSDWPGGMSGGPVFNDSGRVVGVVSRELPGDGKHGSRGSFSLLHYAFASP